MEKQNAGNTALTTLKSIRNNHAESTQIAVKVNVERAVTEEHNVDKQNAGNAVLTALKIIYNNFDIKTTEEDHVVKASKTRQSTESKLATIK